MQEQESVEKAHPSGKRHGTCRICFEQDGDLIQPCSCKGSSQWVHRECLNHWRTAGVTKESMTRCPSCKFEYRLRFEQLVDDDGASIAARQQRFMRRLASQSCLAFVGVQLVIVGLGLLIRAFDRDEVLVQVFGLPQDPGQDQAGDFGNAIRHHKQTYFLAGTVALLACVGLFGIISLCFSSTSCCGERPRSTRAFGHSGIYHRGPRCYCCDVGRGCDDCYLFCGRCDSPNCRCNCPTCPNLGGGGGGNNGPQALLGLLVVALIILVVAGLVVVIMAIVGAIQRAIQQWARIQQFRVLSEEYVVEDLASPFDLGDAEAVKTKEQICNEITEILHGETAPQRKMPQGNPTDYGSAV